MKFFVSFFFFSRTSSIDQNDGSKLSNTIGDRWSIFDLKCILIKLAKWEFSTGICYFYDNNKLFYRGIEKVYYKFLSWSCGIKY